VRPLLGAVTQCMWRVPVVNETRWKSAHIQTLTLRLRGLLNDVGMRTAATDVHVNAPYFEHVRKAEENECAGNTVFCVCVWHAVHHDRGHAATKYSCKPRTPHSSGTHKTSKDLTTTTTLHYTCYIVHSSEHYEQSVWCSGSVFQSKVSTEWWNIL
jgi:hypothetical protein